jgi:outer membrane receptor protein involved in Fe transport
MSLIAGLGFRRAAHRAVRCGSLVAATLALAATSLSAQARGRITGTVKGANGAPLADATVSITTPARSSLTGTDGKYTLRDLAAGSYEVTVTAVGQASQRATVSVSAGQAATLDFSLKAGSILLPGYVVSATKAPVEASKVAATVNFLTPEQVRTTPARETQDMLREISAIEMPRTSSQVGGTAQIVSIRGVDEGRTAVLLDGIPLNDAWGEWIDWNRAPRGSVERVEVFEGGGSNLHGNGAMGGVISLFSKPLTPGSYRLSVDGGSRGGRHSFGTVGLPLTHGLTLGLTGDYGDGGGYQLVRKSNAGPIDGESEAIVRNGIARLEYAPSATLSAFASYQKFGDTRNLGTPLTRARREDDAYTAGVNIGAADKGLLSLRGWTREMTERNVNSTLLTVNNVARAGERYNTTAEIPSQDRGVTLAWTRSHVLGFESVAAGGDYRFYGGHYFEQAYANNAANAKTTTIESGGDQALSGVFVSGVLAPVQNVRVELSARGDQWGNNNGYVVDASGRTAYANQTRRAFSPRAGVRWQALSSLALHTAAYRAFRAPNLAELYRRQTSTSTISLPNPGLKPEYANAWEAGLDWQPAQFLQLKGTFYRADYKDFNTFVTTSATGVTPATRQRQNVTQARSQGGEVYLAVIPVKGLTISGSLNYNDSKVTDMGKATPTATLFKGSRVARVPTQKSTTRISYDNPVLGTLTFLYRTEGIVTTFGNTFTLPSFRVADASYRRDIVGGLSVFGSVENIGNTEYFVGLSGAAASPIATLGLPRTVRVGMEIAR